MRKLTAVDGFYSRFPEGYSFDWEDGGGGGGDDIATALTCQQYQPHTCAITADAGATHVNRSNALLLLSSSSSSTSAPSLPHSATSSSTSAGAASSQHTYESSTTATAIPTVSTTTSSGLAECAVKLFAMGGSHGHFLQAVMQGLRLRSFLINDNSSSSAHAAAQLDVKHHPTVGVCGGQRPLLLLYTDDDKIFTQWSEDRLAMLVEQLRNATAAKGNDGDGGRDGAADVVSDPITTFVQSSDPADHNDNRPPVSFDPLLPTTLPSTRSLSSPTPSTLVLPPPITVSLVLAVFDHVVPLSALQPLMPPTDNYPSDTAVREYLYMHKMDSFHHAPSLWLHRALSFIHAGKHLAKAVLQLDADVMPCQEDVTSRVFSSLGQEPHRFDIVTVVDSNEMFGGTNREPRYPYPAEHFRSDWVEYPERLLHFLLVKTNTFLFLSIQHIR